MKRITKLEDGVGRIASAKIGDELVVGGKRYRLGAAKWRAGEGKTDWCEFCALFGARLPFMCALSPREREHWCTFAVSGGVRTVFEDAEQELDF